MTYSNMDMETPSASPKLCEWKPSPVYSPHEALMFPLLLACTCCCTNCRIAEDLIHNDAYVTFPLILQCYICVLFRFSLHSDIDFKIGRRFESNAVETLVKAGKPVKLQKYWG